MGAKNQETTQLFSSSFREKNSTCLGIGWWLNGKSLMLNRNGNTVAPEEVPVMYNASQ